MSERQFSVEAVEEAIAMIKPKTDGQLLDAVWSDVQAEFSASALAASSPFDAIIEWGKTELPRACRAAGEQGKRVMSFVRDSDTQQNAERVALIAGFLVQKFAYLQAELPVIIAFVILLIRGLSREQEGEE